MDGEARAGLCGAARVRDMFQQAEAKAPSLAAAWPRETRAQRKPFEKLKRAYVDARYNQDTYEITLAELERWCASRPARGLWPSRAACRRHRSCWRP